MAQVNEETGSGYYRYTITTIVSSNQFWVNAREGRLDQVRPGMFIGQRIQSDLFYIAARATRRLWRRITPLP